MCSASTTTRSGHSTTTAFCVDDRRSPKAAHLSLDTVRLTGPPSYVERPGLLLAVAAAARQALHSGVPGRAEVPQRGCPPSLPSRAGDPEVLVKAGAKQHGVARHCDDIEAL